MRISKHLVAAPLAAALIVPIWGASSASAAYNDKVFINSSGGTSATDGLKIEVGPGNRTIFRNGKQQTFTYPYTGRPFNSVILMVGKEAACWSLAVSDSACYVFTGTVGGALDTGSGFTSSPWDTAETTLDEKSVTAPNYRAVSVLTESVGSDLYTLTVTTDYTAPNDYATVTYSLDIPASAATADIRLYDGIDMFLDGSDAGPTTTYVQGGRRTVVQSNATAVGGFREAGTSSADDFGSYFGGTYKCLFGGFDSSTDPYQCPPTGGRFGPYNGSDYPNAVTTALFADAGVGVAWSLGNASTLAGKTVTKKSELFFADVSAVASTVVGSFASSTTEVGKPVNLVYTFTRGIAGIDYTDIDFRATFPAGLTGSTAVTTCGGTATASGSGVSLVNGTLASATNTCTVTVPVTAAAVGTYSLVKKQFTSGTADGVYIMPTMSGTLTVTPQTSPDNGGEGSSGGGSSAGGESTPSPAPTPTPSPTSTVLPGANLEPALPGSNPNIPAGGVPLGGSVFLVNGQPAPVTVKPDAPRDATGLDIEGDGWRMRLIGRTENDRPLGVTPDGALILEQDRTAYTEGSGFKPNSEVKLYVFSTPRFLGTVMTDANGSFRGAVPLPLDIPAGRHTLQSNGLAPSGAVRSLSLGVQVNAPAARPSTRTAKTTVYFRALSAKLDASAKANLRALAAQRAKATTRVMSIGYVQPNDTTRNDKSLSLQRAKAVAAYLKSLGVEGVVVTRGDGIAKETGAAGRKATVTVTYRR